MQKKNFCKICYKEFSRKWNLERHLYDVHEIHDDLRKYRLKQEEIDVPYHLPNLVEPNRKFLNKDNNMNQSPQYNHCYNNINNLPYNFPYCYGYYNNIPYPYPYSNINSQYEDDEEEEEKISIDDKIKIQKVLKNLENYLEKFYPRAFIFQKLSWLHYQCLTQKSDEPLKKFLVQNNIGFLWQF